MTRWVNGGVICPQIYATTVFLNLIQDLISYAASLREIPYQETYGMTGGDTYGMTGGDSYVMTVSRLPDTESSSA
jgi:hypothetical protein